MIKSTNEPIYSDPKHRYLFDGGHLDVSGWLSSFTISMLYYINKVQNECGITGNIAEIGVFHGRFFICLCMMLKNGEKGLAIDVFENQEYNLDGAGVGDYKIFKDNLIDKLKDLNNIHMLKMDSLLLDNQQILDELGGKIRLFSIDGCHTEQHTCNDLTLAAGVIVDGGVIILDDFENDAWPGVEKGLEKFLKLNKDIVPFAIAYNKIYLTNIDFHNDFITFFSNIISRQVKKNIFCNIFETKVIRGVMPVPETILYNNKSPYCIIFSSSHPKVKKYLSSGWSFLEPWGVWSTNKHAILKLQAPNVTCSLLLRIIFHVFLCNQLPKQKITINIAGLLKDEFVCKLEQEYTVKHYKLSTEWLKSNNNRIKVTFDINTPTAPASLGRSIDPRKLGVGLRSILFSRS